MKIDYVGLTSKFFLIIIKIKSNQYFKTYI